jgi:hypothetical protein
VETPGDHDATTPGGPLALIINPDGTAVLTPLPVNPATASAAIRELVGGHFEAIGAGRNGWIAYTAEDERRLPRNLQADAIARALGHHWDHGDCAKGVLVFVGRNGADEADVPENVLSLARQAGIIPSPRGATP